MILAASPPDLRTSTKIAFDIESTLYIIMDMINDSIAPETSFIQPV
jgi:hypothetical protein